MVKRHIIESAEEFVRLRESTDPADYNLATLSDASLSVWLDVICRFPEMKRWVVHNKSVPMQILEKLSFDDDLDVRIAVATKRKLSRSIFDRLAIDKDLMVRKTLAWNAKLPADILELLRQDSEAFVRSAAEERIAALSR